MNEKYANPNTDVKIMNKLFQPRYNYYFYNKEKRLVHKGEAEMETTQFDISMSGAELSMSIFPFMS